MNLHEDKTVFRNLVLSTAKELKMEPAIVEKDYYLTLVLRNLEERIPGILFKGGTCLSKCFRLIHRFSEDIDLTLDCDHFTQGKKRAANKTVIEVCDNLGFPIKNRDLAESHSHGNYNCFLIQYPFCFEAAGITSELKLEMVFIQKAYPDEQSSVDSLMGEWLKQQHQDNICSMFDLLPFPIRVQSLERTFVDKVFALCDYYLNGKILRQSRHVYDLFKLFPRIQTENIERLIDNVREDRRVNKTNVSAQPGQDIPALLREIVQTQYYRPDYEKVTTSLFFADENVAYPEAVAVLSAIAEKTWFTER